MGDNTMSYRVGNCIFKISGKKAPTITLTQEEYESYVRNVINKSFAVDYCHILEYNKQQ